MYAYFNDIVHALRTSQCAYTVQVKMYVHCVHIYIYVVYNIEYKYYGYCSVHKLCSSQCTYIV